MNKCRNWNLIPIIINFHERYFPSFESQFFSGFSTNFNYELDVSVRENIATWYETLLKRGHLNLYNMFSNIEQGKLKYLNFKFFKEKPMPLKSLKFNVCQNEKLKNVSWNKRFKCGFKKFLNLIMSFCLLYQGLLDLDGRNSERTCQIWIIKLGPAFKL